MMTSNKKISKSDIKKMALNEGSLGMEYSWNYERQMNVAFAMMMEPILAKIYGKDTPQYFSGLERHLEFFNITPQFAPFVGGIVASLEESVAKDEIDSSIITQVKTSLMGPLSGIGDSIFLGAIRIIAVGIGLTLSLAGSWLGPLLYLLIYNIPAFWLRLWGANKGYELGFNFLKDLERTNFISKFLEASSVVAMIIVGGMSAGMVWTEFNYEFGQGESVTSLQEILNEIMPNLVALITVWLFYWLLEKKKVKPTIIIICTLIFGIIGAYIGLF